MAPMRRMPALRMRSMAPIHSSRSGLTGVFHQYGDVLSPERVGDLLHGEGVGGRAGADPQQVDAARQRRCDVLARGDLR